ncbi:unnamed protein product [Mycena citricolor]|uniref:Uncharacterized protein n=1 Tax=Mycena citricolor TaxID=2018698 RepID=A0AAD2H7Z2_9AGAR|nr:unnamed protein product [Mycena citricolor]
MPQRLSTTRESTEWDDDMPMPPTTHMVPSTEHQRLVRSMRKLTSVLGQTPVIDMAAPPDTSTPPSPNPGPPRGPSGKRSLYLLGSASLSSLALPFLKVDSQTISSRGIQLAASPVDSSSSGPSSAAAERPALVLRLPSAPPVLPPLSPVSPVFSPATPTDYEEHTRLAMRFAKLTRTLGEQVPPSLVLTAPGGTQQPGPFKRRRRASTLSTPESELEQRVFAMARGVADEGWTVRRSTSVNGGASAVRTEDITGTSFARPSREGDQKRLSVEPVRMSRTAPSTPLDPVHVHPMSYTDPGELSSISEHAPPRRLSRAATYSDGQAFFGPPGICPPPTYEQERAVAQSVPRSSSRASMQSHPRVLRRMDSRKSMRSILVRTQEREDEREWEGEWAGPELENMQDVMKTLRGLKAK